MPARAAGARRPARRSTFTDPDLLEQALVHSSYVNEHPDAAVASNERLEFLGDAVLSLVVSEALWLRHPDEPEGILTTRRAAIVSTRGLARIARRLELGDATSCWARVPSGPASAAAASVLAATFEASWRPSTSTGGSTRRARFVLERRRPGARRGAPAGRSSRRPRAGSRSTPTPAPGAPPRYRVVSVDGPDHDASYVVEVSARGRIARRGEGHSRRDAETRPRDGHGDARRVAASSAPVADGAGRGAARPPSMSRGAPARAAAGRASSHSRSGPSSSSDRASAPSSAPTAAARATSPTRCAGRSASRAARCGRAARRTSSSPASPSRERSRHGRRQPRHRQRATACCRSTYGEVELSRRLFRSGENEYLLNRQRIRLRDLVDLLDDANLADNAFLFIGQGMVDQALALRPEERRPLFEEAAGIRKHERRRAQGRGRAGARPRRTSSASGTCSASCGPRRGASPAQAEQQEARAQAGAELASRARRGRAVTARRPGRARRRAMRRRSARRGGRLTRPSPRCAMPRRPPTGLAQALAERADDEARLRAELDEARRLGPGGAPRTGARSSPRPIPWSGIAHALGEERAAAEARIEAARVELDESLPDVDSAAEDALEEAERRLADAVADADELRRAGQADAERAASARAARGRLAADADRAIRRAAESGRRLAEQERLAAAAETSAAEHDARASCRAGDGRRRARVGGAR